MAHKKGLGSSKNGRDSNPKYLGVKMFEGQTANPGNIIVRQRGTKFRPGTIFFRTSGERRFVSVVDEPAQQQQQSA